MKVTRILHVSVNATGALEETRRFYSDVLGLTPRGRPSIPHISGHWFGAGDGNLHMVGTPDQDEPVGPKGNHYCLGVEDIDVAVAELQAKQIPYKEAGSLAVRQIWIRDPSGATIELQPDRASASPGAGTRQIQVGGDRT